MSFRYGETAAEPHVPRCSSFIFVRKLLLSKSFSAPRKVEKERKRETLICAFYTH